MSKHSEPPAALGRGGVSETVCGMDAGQSEITATAQGYQRRSRRHPVEATDLSKAERFGASAMRHKAEARVARKRPTLREQALLFLANGPATPEQISVAIGRHFTTVRPRVSELARRGKVIATGQRGDGALGGKSMIWRLATPGEIEAFEARRVAGQ